MALTSLGFRPSVPPPEEGDDARPSILTRSDGPGGSIPFRAAARLTSEAGLSAHLGVSHLCTHVSGLAGAGRPRFGSDLARSPFFYEIPLLIS
jgi:hypothetical protein